MMDAQSKTVAGRFSTMKDSINMTLKEVGQALIVAFDLNQVMQNITTFIDTYKKDFVDKIQEGLRVVNFAFSNWSALIDLSVNMGLLSVMKFANDVAFFFTDVIPAAIAILPATIAETFRVILTNASNFAEALWNALQGNGWDFVWEGMSDSFRQELAKIPQIADRQIGVLEAAQQSYVDAQTKKLAGAWNETAPEAAQETQAASKVVASVTTGTAMKELDKVAVKAKEVQRQVNMEFQNNAAVREGSSEFYDLMQQVPNRGKSQPGLFESGKNLVTSLLPGGENDLSKNMLDELKVIAKTVQAQLKKPTTIEVEPAGL
jgi:hypothetical protein